MQKKAGKKAAKDTVKTVAKETAKETAKTTAKVAAKTATKTAAAAAGTAVAPGVGTAIGMAAGYFFGLGLTRAGKGLPDISLLEPLAGALNVSVIELMSGHRIDNRNVTANLCRSRWYLCPV